MSQFLNLDTQFLFVTDMLAFLQESQPKNGTSKAFFVGTADVTHYIDKCVFVVQEKFNQLYADELIDEAMVACFQKPLIVDCDTDTLSTEYHQVLQKHVAVVLNERVNVMKAIVHQTTQLEKLQRQYLALKKERQQLIGVAKSLFTLPTYLLDQREHKKQLSRVSEINLALSTIETFYHALIAIVKP